MKVKSYKRVPWISGLTTAGLNNISSNQLILNDVCIAENFTHLLDYTNLIQIDVCKECFMPGCSTGGYIQVFEQDQFVIWKEPYDEQKALQVETASGLRAGSIYWDSEMYAVFSAEIGLAADHKMIGLPISQAIDLWRIHAVKSALPVAHPSLLNIERIEEDILGFYSGDYSAERSKEIYLSAKRKLLTSTDFKVFIVELPETAVKIVAMMDTNPYKEWDCIYYENDVEYFSIGDHLAFCLEQQ